MGQSVGWLNLLDQARVIWQLIQYLFWTEAQQVSVRTFDMQQGCPECLCLMDQIALVVHVNGQSPSSVVTDCHLIHADRF